MKVYKVMMSLRMSLTVPLLFLIFISGVGAQDWGVIYSPNYICALKGSTVTMGCTYFYPSSHTVKTAFWSKQLVRPGVEPPDLLNEQQYKSRARYIGDKQKDCRLSLRDVRESDQSKYYFRFITDKEGGKYQGTDGVYLSVTGLLVEGPERVMEGDKVTLTCKTTCRLTDRPSFTWYRNGASLSSSTHQFLLGSVSREDAGRYSCSVWGQNLHSPEFTLSVLCLQVEVPERVMEGDKVTLTCKTTCGLTGSTSFTWFRNGTTLSSRTDPLYLKTVSREDAGRYSCGVDQNLRSPKVTLNVLYLQVEGPKEVKERDKVTLTCKPSFTLPSTPTFTWYRNRTTLSSRTEQLYLQSVSRKDAGRYSCAVLDQNLRSPEVTLSVRYLQVEGPEEVMEGDKVTLTCKPSFTLSSPTTFTWYRNRASLSSRTEQLYLQSVSREDAGRYSCAVLDQKLHSPEVTLNIRYPPKSISVSISPSGEIVEGSSVTLTCSSDGNPPVQNYTWFKEGGGSSSVGSGNRYTAVESGFYFCVAQNKYGYQTAAAVTVTLGGVQSSVVFAAVGVFAVCLLVVGVIFFIRRKRSGNSADGADPRQNTDPNAQDDTYTALNSMTRSSNDVYDTLNANADSNAQDDTYTALNPKSRSSNEEYETLATVHSSPSDDA